MQIFGNIVMSSSSSDFTWSKGELISMEWSSTNYSYAVDIFQTNPKKPPTSGPSKTVKYPRKLKILYESYIQGCAFLHVEFEVGLSILLTRKSALKK
jgi:hypothetical protein